MVCVGYFAHVHVLIWFYGDRRVNVTVPGQSYACPIDVPSLRRLVQFYSGVDKFNAASSASQPENAAWATIDEDVRSIQRAVPCQYVSKPHEIAQRHGGAAGSLLRSALLGI